MDEKITLEVLVSNALRNKPKWNVNQEGINQEEDFTKIKKTERFTIIGEVKNEKEWESYLKMNKLSNNLKGANSNE